jgi:hypothetical protein
MEFGHEGLSPARLRATVDAARECGFAAVSANDHFVFSTPWLDGPTALAATVERSGDLDLATTISLVALRGPVPLAKTLAALDILSGGRLIAGLGPGSSERDYDAVGVPFRGQMEALRRGGNDPPRLAWPSAGSRCHAVLRPTRARAGAVPDPGHRHPAVDRKLGVGGGTPPASVWPTGGWPRHTTPRLNALPPGASS